jgi:hypothetical protein
MRKIKNYGMEFIVPDGHPNQPEWGDDFIEEYYDDSSDLKASKVSELWQNYNAFAEGQFDSNSRSSLLWLWDAPDTSQETKDKIVAIQTWWASVWTAYATKKALIMSNTTDVSLVVDDLQNVPYTIWQLT